MSDLYILLPVHNRKDTTLKFIQCLSEQTYKNFKLVLIDDGSTDGTAEAVCAALQNKAIVIKGNGDWWWGGSLQQGYLWLRENSKPEDYVLISNDDVEIDPFFLETGLKKMKTMKNTLLLAEAWSAQSHKKIDQGTSINWFTFKFYSLPEANDVNCLSTRGLLMRSGDMEKIGGFIPEKLPHYCSDYEFTIRAKRKGYHLQTDVDFKLILDEQLTGTHQVDEISIKKYLKSLFSIKSAKNPLTLSKFVLLSSPYPAIPFALFRIWAGCAARMLLTIMRGNIG